MARLVVLLVAVLAVLGPAAGCAGFEAASTDDGRADDEPSDGDGGSGAPDTGACQVDADCVLAASTCCECPTFAIAVGDATYGCDAVDCTEPAPACSAATAACDDGTCALRCPEVVATRTCARGFARDVAGCLIDACAEEIDAEGAAAACAVDADCAQVPADCCGCAQGGADTAVPATAVEAHLHGLACDDDASCPAVDLCDAGAEPRCVAGGCALLGSDDGSGALAALCGSPDLAPCPGGSVCLLNAEDAHDAASLGVGTCRPE